MKKYIESSNEILLNDVEAEGIVESGNTKKEVSEARKKNFMGKPLHSQFMRETDEKRSQETWNWLNKEKLKKDREGMLMAAQDQALGTNKITSKVTNSFSTLVAPQSSGYHYCSTLFNKAWFKSSRRGLEPRLHHGSVG